jgi:predicted kinase
MKMIILVGLPGSGKSSIAKKYFPNHKYVNQDELGSRETCIKSVTDHLSEGHDVIIDRCNLTRKQREYWINLGIGYNCSSITCIVLDVDPEECIARIAVRKNHPTITEDMNLDKKRSIVYQFAQGREFPDLSEGLTNIVITRN